jgi:hypothetical protein
MDEIIIKILIGIGSIAFSFFMYILVGIRNDVKEVKVDLKDNTASTHSLAVKMATVDTNITNIASRVDTLSTRSHNMMQDMAVVKSKLGLPVAHGD